MIVKIEADPDEVVKWSLIAGFTGIVLGIVIAGSAACGCCCGCCSLAYKKRPRTLI